MVRQPRLSVSKKIRKKIFDHQSLKFRNKDATLLCNNCIGGIILHDLKQPFNTPTINLYFHAPDYIAFLERLEFYLSKEITFSYHSKYDSEIRSYPVGKIEDIEMHFVHYHNFGEAKEKWETRTKRVNFDNIFIIGSDKGYCTPQIIERFLKLPYKNKIFFSSKKLPAREIIYFKEYRNAEEVADLINQDHAWYFHFDVVRWLNTGEIKRFYAIAALFHVYRFIKKKYQKLNHSQEKYERSIKPLPTQ
ncbi:MAG: DUF1919 domain-containing protein [Ferruginibacter sp.]